jgi:hypothetical protein
VILIFGIRDRLCTIGSGRFRCPHCGVDRDYELRGARRWFTLFFLPIVPLGAARPLGVRCASCGASFAPSVLDLPTTDVLRDQYGVAFRRCAAAVLRAGDPSSAVARAFLVDEYRELLGEGGELTDDVLDADLADADASQLAVYASPVAGRLDARQAERFFAACAQVALADGPLSADERDALRNLGESLNLSAAHQLGIIETLRAPSERSADGPDAVG